jgi:two-component system LytT family response regulator
MTALIIDDERLARGELRRLLAQHPEIEIVGEAANADEAEARIAELKPELLFLDIQMPGRNGFELLASLKRQPRVIFTTAYDEYAFRAFEVSAVDYLLKPIDSARLAQAIERLHQPVLDTAPRETEPARRLGENDQVLLREGDNCWFVKMRDIRLFESEGNYTRVYFAEHRPLLPRSLNNLEERLDPQMFFRANRQHIINLRCVEKIEPWFSGGLLVRLNSGAKIEMSRRQGQRFREIMSL